MNRGAPMLIFLAAMAAAGQTWAQSRPSSVTLFADDAEDTQIILDGITYSSAAACPSGTANISELRLFGHDLTAATAVLPAVPFQNMCFDAVGNVIGGAIKLNADFNTPALFNGLGLTLGSGSSLTVSSQNGLQFSGAVTLQLPFRDSTGKQTEVLWPNSSLALKAGQSFVLKASGLTLKNALPSASDGGAGRVQFGAFAFTLDNFDLDVERSNGQTQKFLITAHNPKIDVPLPAAGLLSQDGKGMTISATTLAVNQNGELQINNGTASNVSIDLAAPLNFSLHIDQVKFDKRFNASDTGVPKDDCILTGAKLQLPVILSDADSGQRIELTLSSPWDISTTPAVSIAVARNINIGWNGFQVQVPSGSTLVADFSSAARAPAEPAALTDAWQGIYVGAVKLLLPPLFSDASGNTVAVDATGLSIGTAGLSLKVDAHLTGQAAPASSAAACQTIRIAGFCANLKDVALTVVNNHLDAKSMKIDADIQIPALNTLTSWAMQFTDSGNFVLSLQNPNLHLPSFGGGAASDVGGIDLALTNATFMLPSSGSPGALRLSGTLTLDASSNPSPSELIGGLVNVALDFKDLGIDSAGNLLPPASGQFTLTHPVDVDLSVIKLAVTSFTVGSDAPGSPYLLFTGGVIIGEGLPQGAEVDFDGIKITSDGRVSMQGLEVKADVADVVRVDARVTHSPNGCRQNATTTIGCVKGGMKLGINLGSLSLGAGEDGFNFEAAKGAWLFTGKMTLPAGILLGDSGLALYGFQGGVGYKANPADVSQQPPGAQIGDANYLVYLDPTLPGADLLFTAGTNIGSDDDGFNFDADADLTVTTDPFSLDLSARATFQQTRGTPFASADRTAFADIKFTAPSTLHASANADLYYPFKSAHLIEAHGSLDLLMSPDEQHLFLGWPTTVSPINVIVGIPDVEQFAFSGGLGVHTKGTALPADRDPFSGSTGAWFAASLNWHGDIGPLSADIGGSADVSLWGPGTPAPGTLQDVAGTVYASGQADFGPFTASAEGSLSAAYLSGGASLSFQNSDGDTVKVGPAGANGEIYLDGEFEGCVSALVGTVCKSLHVTHEFN
ncbi:MAG TPA: hypothetical protein VHW69_14555 [Rhizomicrobium sp.]|jgi:hypothetical protein|nr:hypothetical protein [Rhizomicrobium sp.]